MTKIYFKRYFFISIVSSILFILLLIGITVVEKNSEVILSGENLVFLSYKFENSKINFVKFHFMGKNFIFNFN